MKKIFTLAAIALFTMTSCSDDDSTSTTNPVSDVMLTKTIDDYGDGELVTSTYTNDGNKTLVVTTTDGELNTATFNSNNQLTKFVYTLDGDANGEETFAYNSNNQLITYILDELEAGIRKSTYTYNTDGTVSSQDYLDDVLQGTTVRTFANGNLVKTVFTSATDEHTETDVYTFDDKNDPTKNEASHAIGVIYVNYGGVNNILTQTHTTSNNMGNYTISYTYTYNDAGYPLTSVVNGSMALSTQYFYN